MNWLVLSRTAVENLGFDREDGTATAALKAWTQLTG
jgi:hypothetical protein